MVKLNDKPLGMALYPEKPMSSYPEVNAAWARCSDNFAEAIGPMADLARALHDELATEREQHDASMRVANRENAALREAQAQVFRIAMDCINGRISDVDALQRLEAHARGPCGDKAPYSPQPGGPCIQRCPGLYPATGPGFVGQQQCPLTTGHSGPCGDWTPKSEMREVSSEPKP